MAKAVPLVLGLAWEILMGVSSLGGRPIYAAAPELSYQEFDQTPGNGWRTLVDNRRFAEAGRMIESYLAEQAKLTSSEKANLHFHAAQCFAMEGSKTDITSALVHLRYARIHPESADSPIRWNDYVTATEAFLMSDLPLLRASRARIASGPRLNGEVVNLDVVDRLIAKFGESYATAYRADRSAGRESRNGMR